MAKKRKVVKSTTQKTKRIKKTIPEPEPEPIEETEQIEEEEEEEEEEQVDLEDNDDEEEEDEDEEDENALTNTNGAGAGAGNDGEEEEEEGDDEEEPVSKLLEPFTKEQLIEILQLAADNHEDVLENIRKISDTDPVHRKIFVHGLGWDTNSEILTSVFKKYGEIEECNAVTDKMTGKSKGYAFILFKRRSGARKALKEPQKKIGSRMTACQLASAGPVPNQPVQAHVHAHAQPVLPAVAVSEYTQRKIYVSNVSADIDPQKLLGFFAKFGEVEEGPLGMDKQTGKPKGFALFVYKSVESAKKALEEPHKSFEGHILHCQKAIDGPKPIKPHFQQHSHGGGRPSKFPQIDKFNYGGGHTSGGAGTSGHLMAQSAGPGMAYSQGASPALNPVLGQALTAFIASQGGGMGLTNLLGTLGPAGAAVNPVAQPMMQGGYSNQYVGTGYASQPGMHGGYSHTQAGQGSSGRSQKGAGHMGGMNPFMGH